MHPPHPLPYAGQVMLGLLAFSVIVWITEAVDYAVSAVLIVALMAFLLGFAPNPARPDVMLGTSAALGLALGGFANTALALVAAATFLAAGMTVTGLDKRVALFVLSKVGARTSGACSPFPPACSASGLPRKSCIPSTLRRPR